MTDVSTLELNAAGLGLLVRASQNQGIGVDVPGPIQALFERRLTQGHGADSLASLIAVIRKPKAG